MQGVKVERQEKEGDAAGEEDETHGVKFAAVVEEGLPSCALALALGDETLLVCLGVVMDQKTKEGKGYGWYEDSEGPKAPAPARSTKVSRGDWAS